MNVNEIISKARPNSKPSTIKQYSIQLNQLKKMFDSENYDFLKSPKNVFSKLESKHFTTQRNFYNSIIVLLMALDEKKELIDEYIQVRDELNEKYNDSQTNKISEKQKKNFATMEEIEKMLNQMLKEIKTKRLKSKKNLNGKEKELLMMYTIFNMLKIIPTRNEIAGMKLTTPKKYSKEDKEFNYLVVGRDKMYYMMNNFKTDKTYGKDKKIDIPVELSKIIRIFIRQAEKKTGDVLFTTSTGNPISKNVLSQMLLKTSKKYIDKGVSTTLMRKIVVSHELGDLKKKQEDLAHKMGHSVSTQNKIYIKES